MTEAARAFVENCSGGALATVSAREHLPTISASLRVQEKLGFIRVGESSLFCNPRGAEFLHVDMVLTRDRFLAGPP